jgi:hypothetical protein
MDAEKKECINSAYQEESKECSNSFWLKTGIWSHVNYMGIEVSGICDRRQPGGTLLAESLNENDSYADYSFIMDQE